MIAECKSLEHYRTIMIIEMKIQVNHPVNIHTNNFTKEPKNVKYDQTDKYRLVADKHTFIILKVF